MDKLTPGAYREIVRALIQGKKLDEFKNYLKSQVYEDMERAANPQMAYTLTLKLQVIESLFYKIIESSEEPTEE